MRRFLEKNSTKILTVLGATGVVVTSVLAVRATPKAIALLEDKKRELDVDKLKSIDIIKTVWKPYIPAIISGCSTIICIFGIEYLSSKRQASLMSAYALLDNAYKEYQNGVKETYGDDADINVKHEIVRTKYNEYTREYEDLLLFFDFNSMRYFEATMDEVMRAECMFLESLHNKKYAFLNEYYDYLGIPYTSYGYQVGWFDVENNDPYNCRELEFEYEKILIKDDIECYIITTSTPPAYDFII